MAKRKKQKSDGKSRRSPKSDRAKQSMRDEQDKKTMKDSGRKKSPAPTGAEGQAPSKVRPAPTGVEDKVDDGESASSLFKEAIAAFEEAQEGQEAPRDRSRGRSRSRKEPEPDEVEVVVDGEVKGAAEAKQAEETVEPSPPARAPEPEKPAPTPSNEAEAGKEAPGKAPSRKDAPKAEPGKAPDSPKEKPGPEADDSLPAADALAMIERRKLRKTLRREGEPESPAGAYEPKEVEYHGSLMKFTCRCGKRVSVAIDAAQTVGRCPKCGSRLVVPVAGRSKPAAEAPDEPKKKGKKKEKKLRGARSRHRAAHDVADRMRRNRTAPKKLARPIEVVAEPDPADGPVWGTRVSAFLIDQTILAVAFFVAVSLLEVAGLGGSRWTLAAALACVMWAANRVVVLWLFHASVGMLVVGLRLTLAEAGIVPFGRTALRAATGVALLPLAPLALRNAEGRAPADRAAGTLIVPGRRPF